jgi:4-amino-4-deoxy-L-arabinose transferase-like glycosyltransferase
MTGLKESRFAGLAGALALAAGVRLYLLLQDYCISSDGVRYIDAARAFFAGDWAAGLASWYPPGYPLMIAALFPLTGDWEVAGRVWALICGVALILPLYGLLRAAGGERVALAACALAAIGPYLARYSVDVRTESPFLFFTTASLFLVQRGSASGGWRCFLAAGASAGFAYLLRPEAAGLLAVAALGLAFEWRRQRLGSGAAAASLLAFSLGFMLFAAPYVWHLSREAGTLTISRKAGLTFYISLQEAGFLKDSLPPPSSSSPIDYARENPWTFAVRTAYELVRALGAFAEALHYAFLPFLLWGLIASFGTPWQERRDWWIVFFFVFYVLSFAVIYANRRYLLQVVPVSLLWAAEGLERSRRYLSARLEPAWSRRAFAAVVLLVSLLTLPKALKPVGGDKMHVREAGLYLQSRRAIAPLRLLALDNRLAFYADASLSPLEDLETAELIRRLEAGEADYLAADAEALGRRYPEIARAPEAFGLVAEKEFGSGHARVVVFRVAAGDGRRL